MRKYIKENDFCGHLCQYAEQTIRILQNEVAELKVEKEALIAGQETLQKYIIKLTEKGNTTMKEITAITTVEITEIAKVKDEVYAKYGSIESIKAEIEQQVKDIIYHAFDCDTVTVKHQIFVRDDVVADDDTDNN
ncbi:MAG: hypothetical protein J6S14_11650 [Clostridia bacterium]|nr:hypothetical protein [Clostridia bacterium]